MAVAVGFVLAIVGVVLAELLEVIEVIEGPPDMDIEEEPDIDIEEEPDIDIEEEPDTDVEEEPGKVEVAMQLHALESLLALHWDGTYVGVAPARPWV